MSSSLSSSDVEYIQKILDLVSTDSDFQTQLLEDASSAIDSSSGTLGFDHSKLSEMALELIVSLTEEELAIMVDLKNKAKKYSVETRIFVPL